MQYWSSILAMLLLFSFPATAQTVTHYFAGTGFFVSRSGELVTNAHVVQNCVDITLRGPSGELSADLVASDAENDLALLRTLNRPTHIAELEAEPFHHQPNDRVQFIGYPGEYSYSGKAHITDSTIVALYGPLNEPRWLQFADSADHGNSGGPLLDRSGVVIGVVTGKATVTREDAYAPHGQTVTESDVAISLPVLKQFLSEHGVQYQDRQTQLYESDERIKELAEGYTVQVLCRQK